MYTIYMDNQLLYSPNLIDEGYVVSEPKLSLGLNKSGSLTFLLPPVNPLYNSVNLLTSIITVMQDDEELFRGRVLHQERDFYNNKDIYCEGELSFLIDSIQRPYVFKSRDVNDDINSDHDLNEDGNVDLIDLFTTLINNHNEQVDDWKKFKIGIVNAGYYEELEVNGVEQHNFDDYEDRKPVIRSLIVKSSDNKGMNIVASYINTDVGDVADLRITSAEGVVDIPEDMLTYGVSNISFSGNGTVEMIYTTSDIYINNKNYTSTLDEISDQLIAIYGGYVRPRLENGVCYIDYINDYNHTSSQTIEFGVNLLDISEYITAEEIFTVLIPLGYQRDSGLRKTIEEAEITVYDDNGKASKVAYGKDYIEADEDVIKMFGRIYRTQTWDDIKTASDLYTKGKEYLKESIEKTISLTVSAADLHLFNIDTEKIRLGDKIRVVSVPHNIDTFFTCSEITIDLENVEQNEYVLGHSYTTLTEQQSKGAKIIQNTTNESKSVSSTAQETAVLANATAQTVDNASESITIDISANGDATIVSSNTYAFPFLKVCFLGLEITTGEIAADAEEVVIATLPEIYAPIKDTYAQTVVWSENAVNILVKVKTNGAVSILTNTDVSTGTKLYITGSWNY